MKHKPACEVNVSNEAFAHIQSTAPAEKSCGMAGATPLKVIRTPSIVGEMAGLGQDQSRPDEQVA
jgi:hypothetical protein